MSKAPELFDVSDLDTNVTGEENTVTTGIAPGMVNELFSHLVNMYPDVSSIVREYVSNGRDASVQAGTDAPVHVTVPTILNPVLKISDKGVGMTYVQVVDNFLTLMGSSKRDDDALIGCWGLGAKAAWMITDSFVVDTVKDGKRTVVTARKSMTHTFALREAPTDLPNGTTVTIPVNGDENWEERLKNIASGHPHGSVLVDGEPVESVYEEGKWLGPVRISDVQGKSIYDAVIISGGAFFKVPSGIETMIRNEVGSYAMVELPLGTFDFLNNRESVIDNDRTRRAVRKALEEFKTKSEEFIVEIGELAKTDVFAAATKYRTMYGTHAQSQKLPFSAHIPALSYEARTARYHRDQVLGWSQANDSMYSQTVGIMELMNVVSTGLLVTGVPQGKRPAQLKSYMEHAHPDVRTVWVHHEGESVPEIHIRKGSARSIRTAEMKASDSLQVIPMDRSMENLTVVSYEEIREVAKSLRQSRPVGARSKRLYGCLVVGDSFEDRTSEQMTLDEIKETAADEGYEVMISENAVSHARHLTEVVLVDPSHYSTNPLVKAIPEIKNAQTVLMERLDELASKVDSRKLEVLAAQASHGQFFSDHIDAAIRQAYETLSVSNPDSPTTALFGEFVKYAADVEDVSNDPSVKEYQKMARTLGFSSNGGTALMSSLQESARKVRTMYPLLDGYTNYEMRRNPAFIAHIAGYLSSANPM